jgi:hypothetical protein
MQGLDFVLRFEGKNRFLENAVNSPAVQAIDKRFT